MNFAEALPVSCPPADAVDVELQDVFRLAHDKVPVIDHFLSYAALRKPIPHPGIDQCGWASCSLTTDPINLKKLSKMRHRYAFKMSIPAGSGLSKKQGIHVHFWRLSAFDPVAAVVDTKEL